MRIIDAHHHIWIPQQTQPDLGYAWLRDIGSMKPFGDPTPIQRDYLWEEFSQESNEHELVGSVYLQVDAGIADPVAEIAWAQSAIDLPDDQKSLVGFVDLTDDNAQSIIEMQKKQPSFRGVRQILSYLETHPQLCFSSEHLLRNPKWQAQFALLAEHNLSFDLQLYPEQMIEAAEFLAQHPTVPVAIDHCGSPYDQTSKGLETLATGLAVLAQLPQTDLKLCGFGMFNRDWNANNIKPAIDIALNAFGAQRIMFGSNFPVDKLMCSYDDCVQRIADCVDEPSMVEQIFENTARRFYCLANGV